MVTVVALIERATPSATYTVYPAGMETVPTLVKVPESVSPLAGERFAPP